MRTHLSSFFKSPAIRRWTLFTAVLTPLLATLAATQPAWWGSGEHAILNGHPANNHGTANLGQAKHMAASAIEALREVAPVVAGNIEADLAGTVDLAVPNPKTPEWLAQQQGALVIGQLKALATPFYDRLHSVAPEWLEQQRAAAGSQHTGTHLPWTPDTTDDANTSPANIGQLKAVFALDFATLPAASLDSDGDDMPDAWEMANGLNANDPADANEDPDGDGLTNAQEQIIGADPNVAENQENIGDEAIVNGDFSLPAIYVPGGPNGNGTTGLEATKGQAGWNYWEGIPGWTAVKGKNVELQSLAFGPSNPYVELKAHPTGHQGIQQWIETRKGVTYIVLFKSMPRPYVESSSFSNFEVYADETRIKQITYTEPTDPETLDWEPSIGNPKSPSSPRKEP